MKTATANATDLQSRLVEILDNTLPEEVRGRLTRFLELGAAHLQIGKTYLYKEGADAPSWRLLEAIKTAIDPQRLVHPGSLGLK